MRKLCLFIAVLTSLSLLQAQTVQEVDAFNTTLKDQLYYNEVGVNDVWGYAAPDGTEYALVGLSNALSIVSLADPDSIVELQRIPGQQTTWRDIKTLNDHAYVVSDNTSEGLLIVDLSTLPGEVGYRYINMEDPDNGTVFRKAHNIFIDTTRAYAYMAGSNLNDGGMVIYDIGSQPDTALLVAYAPSVYAHDVYVQDGYMYASEIYQGTMSVYDVNDVNNIVNVSRTFTPFSFTHNAWTNLDKSYVFTTDERPNAPVAAYDITNENNPVLVNEFRPERSVGLGTIPHNVHVLDDYLFISYYSDGLEIADASVAENIIEVGYFDSWPSTDDLGFNGNWGAYPFLPSGLILMSDRTYGLHLVEVNLKRGARLHGRIIDATTGEAINNVNVELTGPDEKTSTTNASGDYRTGSSIAGSYTATFSVFGYNSLAVPVSLENGIITVLDTTMTPASVGTSEFIADDSYDVTVYPNPTTNLFQVDCDLEQSIFSQLHIQLFDVQGALLLEEPFDGSSQFGKQLVSGTYFLQILEAGRVVYATKLVKY